MRWKKPYRKNFLEKAIAEGYQHDELKFETPCGVIRGTYLFKPSTKGPFSIFFHGTGNDRIFPYLHLFTEILNRNGQVLTIGLPGHEKDSESILSAAAFNKYLAAMSELLKPFLSTNTFFMGDSLGALVALDIAYRLQHQAPFFAISPPAKVVVDAAVYVNEVAGLLRAKKKVDIVQTYGVYGALPAFGKFKRREFPIRLEDQTADYVAVVKNIVETFGHMKKLKEAHPRSAVAIGGKDRIIGGLEPWEILKRDFPGSLLVHKDDSHASHLFSQECFTSFQKFLDGMENK